MPRTAALICALSLAVATSTTLTALGVTLTGFPGRAAAVTNAAHARAFYAGIDTVLRSGDTSALEAVVAADFVDHPAAGARVPGRDALIRELAGWRASFTDLQATTENMVVDGDRAAALVVVRGTRRIGFPVPPLGQEPVTWQTIEILRIAEGRV